MSHCRSIHTQRQFLTHTHDRSKTHAEPIFMANLAIYMQKLFHLVLSQRALATYNVRRTCVCRVCVVRLAVRPGWRTLARQGDYGAINRIAHRDALRQSPNSRTAADEAKTHQKDIHFKCCVLLYICIYCYDYNHNSEAEICTATQNEWTIIHGMMYDRGSKG